MKRKILVIDDDEIIRSLARKILEHDGHDVITTESSGEGLNIFHEQHEEIGLILLDWKMERLSGEETLYRIRQVSDDIPCIISSGETIRLNDLQEDLRGNQQFLQKPYRVSALSELVKTMLATTAVSIA